MKVISMKPKLKCYNLLYKEADIFGSNEKLKNCMICAYDITEARDLAKWACTNYNRFCPPSHIKRTSVVSVERIPMPKTYTPAQRQRIYQLLVDKKNECIKWGITTNDKV